MRRVRARRRHDLPEVLSVYRHDRGDLDAVYGSAIFDGSRWIIGSSRTYSTTPSAPGFILFADGRVGIFASRNAAAALASVGLREVGASVFADRVRTVFEELTDHLANSTASNPASWNFTYNTSPRVTASNWIITDDLQLDERF